MKKTLLSLIVLAGSLMAQYKMEPASAPPELAPDISKVMQKDGAKVLDGKGGTMCEVWFRTSAPSGPKVAEEGVTLPFPHGALLGVLRFTSQGSDRRGQLIKPGVYTLRYSLQPVNGDHLGAAPQRDFLVMVPVAEDKDPNSMPVFDPLMAMSKKASGTPHPAVLSISPSSSDKFPNFAKEGDHDWVLHVKIGETPVAVILVGKAEG